MKLDEIRNCLTKKLEILEKIRANTESQSRLVSKLRMTGLRRLLRERAALIDELAAVDSRLESEPDWQGGGLFPAEARAMAVKQKEVLAVCDAVMRQAMAEQERIKAELTKSRVMRQAKKRYVHNWQVNTLVGNRLNVKG